MSTWKPKSFFPKANAIDVGSVDQEMLVSATHSGRCFGKNSTTMTMTLIGALRSANVFPIWWCCDPLGIPDTHAMPYPPVYRWRRQRGCTHEHPVWSFGTTPRDSCATLLLLVIQGTAQRRPSTSAAQMFLGCGRRCCQSHALFMSIVFADRLLREHLVGCLCQPGVNC